MPHERSDDPTDRDPTGRDRERPDDDRDHRGDRDRGRTRDGRGRLTLCWGAKGGSGTSVVAAALALHHRTPTVLVDLAGDLPAVLGTPEPATVPGAVEWFVSDAPGERLRDLLVDVTDHVRLLPRGRDHAEVRDALHGAGATARARWVEAVDTLTAHGCEVVADAGVDPPVALHDLADRSLLVTRPCYLALRRAVAAPTRPSGVILVTEPGRALREVDVEAAVGAPIVASIASDPAVARAVDAGLLASRLPRGLARDLRDAA